MKVLLLQPSTKFCLRSFFYTRRFFQKEYVNNTVSVIDPFSYNFVAYIYDIQFKQMNISKIVVLALAVSLLMTSCVSKKKYNEMATLKKGLQGVVDSQDKSIEDLQTAVDSLNKEVADCQDDRNKLINDTTRLAAANRKLRGDMGELSGNYERVSSNYKQLKAKSSEKLRELLDQLETAQSDLELREKRLAEVESMLHQRDSVMNLLHKRVTDALLGFKDDGLTVEVKDGKVYVSLSNKLLFASGSTKIDANGQNALAGLANVLKDQHDLSIMVEGHTDDVPVSNLGAIKDNWDLSVMRSTEVVRLLVKNGVTPTRIVPAGRGEFIPKVEGSSTEARASNRRTEIVISPKLDELYDLINQQR